QPVRTSPGTVFSLRGGIRGSPSITLVARHYREVIGYKDLAAIPQDKAILNIERPDLMMYEPYFSYSTKNRTEGWSELRLKSPGTFTCTSTQTKGSTPIIPRILRQQHFHRPDNGTNIYKKQPIYKKALSRAVPKGKHLEDLIIESSKFPAAQPPDPSQPSKIESDFWPCPPSLAVSESERRKKMAKSMESEEVHDENQSSEELWSLWQMRKQKVNSLQSRESDPERGD
ncbi:hypothetical protein DNTS_013772, partial [Danionella cerebrum]